MSDATLADPFDVVAPFVIGTELSGGVTVGRAKAGEVVGGMLVDAIEGGTTFTYRRALADWLRVIANDGAIDEVDFDKANFETCMAYQIEITPFD